MHLFIHEKDDLKTLNLNDTNFDAPDAHFDKLSLFNDQVD
jgi:hypothetical protein